MARSSHAAPDIRERNGTSTKRLAWYPQPKQHALISCPVEDVLFGGA